MSNPDHSRSVTGRAPADEVGEILVTSEQIRARVAELGAQITKDYAGKRPLLVAVLRGAYMFLADLSREIDLQVEIDFMAVSSYGNETSSSGVVRILKDLDEDLEGRHVLVVEDIIDSGLTLGYLRRNLKQREAASVEVCALLVREGRQRPPTNWPMSALNFLQTSSLVTASTQVGCIATCPSSRSTPAS